MTTQLDFFLSELETLDRKIEKTKKTLLTLSKQTRDANCKLKDLLDKREALSVQYKSTLNKEETDVRVQSTTN